jgi:hypothetical protein
MKITNENELRFRLKELGNYTRRPKTQAVDTFYAIKHVADMHKNMDDDCEMFVSTTHLQNMGIHRTTYQKVFSYAIEFVSNEWEWVKGKCRVIKNFTPGFQQLLDDASDLVIPQEIIKGYSHSTTDLENKDLLTEKWEEWTDKPFQDYYTSTHASPFRKYNPFQLLPKSLRNKLFQGCYDVDLKSAHTTIAFNELNMNECNLEMAWALHPDNKDVLIDRIMNDFKCNEEEAKRYRCYLTTTKKNFFGVQWFDKLHIEIERRVKQKYTSVQHNGKDVEINTPHKYFTYIEQQIIGQLTNNDTVLNIHDGIITKNKVNTNSVIYNNNQYPITVKEI